jgi:hypothetical protein
MRYAQVSGRLKVKLLVTLPVGHGGRALDAGPPLPCNQLAKIFWDAGRVSAAPISVNPGLEGQKRAMNGLMHCNKQRTSLDELVGRE